MTHRKHPPMRDRRDVGQVVFLSEKLEAARALNSCCVGVEAALETDRGLDRFLRAVGLRGRDDPPERD